VVFYPFEVDVDGLGLYDDKSGNDHVARYHQGIEVSEFSEYVEENFMVFKDDDIFLELNLEDKIGENNAEFTISWSMRVEEVFPNK
jgi:hypothetical protein